jgi:hypothetical protein
MFWVTFGGQKGFEVRKKYANKRQSDGKVRSCRYVCANEGHRVPDKRDHLTKCPRAETRTDCPVRIGLILDREKGNYKVTDLILEHNHSLHLPQTSHLMVSQRKISPLQGFEIETADDAGIGPKAAHELACIQVGGSANLSYTTEVLVDDGATLQNACLDHPSLPQEEISKSYTVINSFSQLLTVILQSNTFFLLIIHGHYVELFFFYFSGDNDRWCYW